jgi:hypothetical protein
MAMTWLHKPIVLGALVGALAAARVDYSAFKAWRSFHEFAVYDWRTALFRWVQGAVVGAVTASGFDAWLG